MAQLRHRRAAQPLQSVCRFAGVHRVLGAVAFAAGVYPRLLHSEVVAEGALYTANFVVSMVVFVLLGNWLYMKSGRSILIAVLFHVSANFGNEIFATHPDSKVIQTMLLLLFTLWLLRRERKLFFSQTANHAGLPD